MTALVRLQPPALSMRRRAPRSYPSPRRAVLGTLGFVVLLAIWEWVGASGVAGRTFPPLTGVVGYLVDPGNADLFGRALRATVTSAVVGLVAGAVLGVAVAVTGVLVPPLRGGLDRLAAVVHAIPLIALGPLLIVTFSRESTPMAIASLAVFFNVFVASSSGLRSASAAHHDVFTTFGATRQRRFAHLLVPTALPAIADGLRLAAPAAVLGAVLGEWFGAPRGIGILIVSAMQNYQIELLWAASLLGAAVSLLAFAVFGTLDAVLRGRYR